MTDKAPTTAELKHRIHLCTAADVVTESGRLVLARAEVWNPWAKIEPHRGSMFAKDGVTVKEKRDQQSHRITIRYRPTFKISTAAWVYEARRVSEPRWFKVLSVKDIGENARFWELSCRLVETSDDISAPGPLQQSADGSSLVVPLPDGVAL